MGCRTRANEYYSRVSVQQTQVHRERESMVEGNAVRQTRVKHAPKQVQTPSRSVNRRKVTANLLAAEKRQKRIFAVLGTVCTVVFIGMCAFLLNCQNSKNAIASSVSEKEVKYDTLVTDNEARENEINNSVDLDYVIEVAVGELGMIRSNPSQVVMYSANDSEFIQQVAQVPVD